MKYISTFILLSLLLGCSHQTEEARSKIYKLVFDELCESLYIPALPPKEIYLQMDSMDLQNYVDEKSKPLRKANRTIHFHFLQKVDSNYSLSEDTILRKRYTKVYNQLLSPSYADIETAFQVLSYKPEFTIVKYKDFRFHRERRRQEHIVELSRVQIQNDIAIIYGGIQKSQLNGYGGIFYLKKARGKWQIIEFDIQWIS